jgi:Leucine-rich repeat (LRR) protein
LNIQELDLDHNQLTGTIPDSISKLVKLKSLDLSHNQLSGKIPPGLGELTQLTKLDLSNNNFEGDVPISLGNLTNLKKLNLDSNENLNIVLSDEVCDRTKQCMPPVDEDAASQRSVLAILSLVLSLSTWWIMM